MNLKSRKARVPIAALGVTALCTTGMGVLASSAFAADLTLTPTATSATITDVGMSSDARAETSYGLKLASVPAGTLYASVTGPTGAAVLVDPVTDGTPPALADSEFSVPVTATLGGFGTPVGTYAAGKTYYLAATTPGAYTVKFFSDANGNTTFDSGVDSAAPDFALTVKDVTNNTADTADDLAFSVTTTAAIDLGELATTKVSIPTLTTTDARGNVAGKSYGKLGAEIADITTVAFSGVAGATPTSDTSTVYDGTSFNLTNSAGPTASGTMLSTAKIASASKTASTTVSDNGITTLAYTPTPGAGVGTANVLYASNTATTVRAGTNTVTYKVKATGTGSAAIAGKKVFFRLADTGSVGSGIDVADLTTSAGAPDSDGDVGVTTDGSGIATLTVTVPTAKAIAGASFSVTPRSNGHVIGAATVATFATAAPTTITVNNVAALVGGTATITGKVIDQFGEASSPNGVSATITRTAGTFTPSSGTYPISSTGTFSATVTDAGSTTVSHNDTFSVAVPGATTVTGKMVAWLVSTTAATATSVDIDSSAGANTALPFVATTTRAVIANSAGFNSATFRGTVKDSGGNLLPYAPVTYTGSAGVYFIDAQGKLVTSLTAPTTSSGQYTADTANGIEVVFTKSGTATITAKSGVATSAVTVPVADATDRYKVTATDAKNKPGDTITLTGTIKDLFGNPVVGRQVDLKLTDGSAGTLGGTDVNSGLAGLQVTSDTNGVWSVPFTSNSNQSGTVTLTATLLATGDGSLLTDNSTLTAATAYATAGLTIGAGEYTDQATIKVAVPALTLESSAKLTYGSKYYARGALLSGDGADPGADVDIYSKVPGGTYSLIDTVKADENGEFGVAEKISKSTYFLAKSGAASSSASPTRIYSGVVLVATSSKADRVTLSANGGPNATAYLYFYRVFASGDTDYLGKKLSSSAGNGSRTFAAPSGNRKYKVLYKAPGTTTGSDTDSVKVK